MDHIVKSDTKFGRSYFEKKKAMKDSDTLIPARPVVLAVDDDPARLASLRSVLEPEYSVRTADGSRAAIRLLKAIGAVDVLIIDLFLPDHEGSTLIRYVNEMIEKPDQIVKILLSEPGNSLEDEGDAFRGRIDHRFDRPFDPVEIKKIAGSLLAQKSREKRRIMRAAFNREADLEVEIGHRGKAAIANLSESGMFVKTILPLGYLLPFKIFLPEGPPLLATGRVIRVDEENGGVGVNFLLFEEESRETLVRFLSDHVLNDSLSDLKEKYPFLQVDRIVAFTDKAKIVEWISQAQRSQTEITAIHPDQRTPASLRLEAFESWHDCRFSGENLDTRFKTSDSLFISFQIGYATYNFETVVYRISSDGTRLECLFPRIVFYSEKRSLKRTASDGQLEAEIILPEPFGAPIRGAITDISEGGVSFVAEAAHVALLIGTPLESIRIFHESKLVREVRGEVRNIQKIDGNGQDQLRYGVQFGIGRLTVLASEMAKMSAPGERPRTHPTDKFGTGPKPYADMSELAKEPPQVIRLENRKGEEIVGLLNTSLPLDQNPIPVVIVPPAFGKTKETLFALAQTIVENFCVRGKPIAVIRFDGIRCKGESHKDPDAFEPPYEMVHASLSQGAEDIRAVLDWLQLNPMLKASAVILVSFSLSALEARIVLRDELYRERINYWITCMGTMEFRELMNRVNCGLDLLEQHQLGVDLGVIPLLGNLISMKPYAADVVANRVATLDQAREDMRHLDIPITWIYGEHDHWVKAEFVRDIMSVHAEAAREVISLPIGHNARTSEEALHLFATVTFLIHRFLYKDTIKPALPDKENMDVMRRAEKDRLPPRKIKNRQEYWQRYLVGERNLVGFDVMALSDDYQGLMRDQIEALDLRSGDRLLDLGGGTGNLIEYLLSRKHPLPAHMTIADLIPQAMKLAHQKLVSRFADLDRSGTLDLVCLDVEMSRYLPVRRFLDGEIGRFRALSERIENLPLQSGEVIDEAYSPRLHRIIRGDEISPEVDFWLKGRFDLPEYRIIVDFNRAVRYLQGSITATPTFRRLVFNGSLEGTHHLPFKNESYDKIVMSLVLSYIFNPVETLLDLKRIIAPGGRLVLSSMRPDTDASGLFTRLVAKIEAAPPEAFPSERSKSVILDSIRSFLNDAQALVELEEAGTFDFFEPEKLDGLLEEAGWECLLIRPSFGDPPQGYVAVAKVRDGHG
jgi:ubiquinone/menaquinone biosynthesis C-methylase UbiE/CheY-like chemotaxis protein